MRRRLRVRTAGLAILGLGLAAFAGEAGPPLVHERLPWHRATLDDQGVLVP